jgi:hypothetical protein
MTNEYMLAFQMPLIPETQDEEMTETKCIGLGHCCILRKAYRLRFSVAQRNNCLYLGSQPVCRLACHFLLESILKGVQEVD